MRTLKLKNTKNVKFIKPKTTFRKYQLRNVHTKSEQNLRKLIGQHGNFSLSSNEAAWITGNQLEAARKLVSRGLKKTNADWKTSSFYIKILPIKPLSAKSKGVRMGKGKGLVKGFVSQIRRGRIIFEIKTKSQIKLNLIKCSKKFPISVKIHEKPSNYLF